MLKKEGGFQDQYISALGGIKRFTTNKEGQIKYNDIKISVANKKILTKKMILVYTNKERKSDGIIKSQKVNLKNTINAYDKIKIIGKKSEDSLINADIKKIGKLFDDHWKIKKGISLQISNNALDKQYKSFKENGAIGGKIIGAGGGGFYLLASDDKLLALKNYIKYNDYNTIDWAFDEEGSVLINT